MMKFMKKYIFILLGLVALGLGQGCTERLDVPDIGTAEGETCLNFSVAVPEQGSATRAVDISEKITSLWVLVFDSNDFFVEAKQASAKNAFGTDENTVYEFTVSLQASPSKRTLHLVANRDFSGGNYPEYNHEYYLMSHLTVTNKDDMPQTYWQKVVLEDGIPVIPTEEEIKKMTSDEKAAWDAEKAALETKITRIPLVRNFAKVTLESTTNDFEVEGFALYNVPDRGSVAPCVMAASDFAVYAASDTDGDEYGNNPWVSRSYDELSESYDGSESTTVGFSGFLPADVAIVSDVPKVYNTDAKSMYERPYSGDDTNTAIIVKGKYNGGESSYFKIDFVKEVNPENGFNVYYNILRNFEYHVDIRSCKSSGYSSPEEAIKAPSMNNFLFSVDTQDYSNISDGTARIFVEYTEKTIVSSSPFEFKLKYVPDISKPNEADNFKVHVRDKDSKMEFSPKGTEYGVSQSAVVHSIITSTATDSEGWVTFTVTPQALPKEGESTQSVVFYVLDPADTEGKTLLVARTVILHLRQPSVMKIDSSYGTGTSGIPTATNTAFVMNLYLPTGLNKSVFPLEFKIESANNNITPNSSLNSDTYKSGYMSTWYGTSISGSGKQTFGFTKSITYDEYNALASDSGNNYKILPCAFKTTKATTGTNTIYVSNPYFTPNPTSYSG